MRKMKRFAVAALIAVAGANASLAQVSAVVKSVPANGDAVLSVPVNKAVEETVSVTSVAGANVTVASIAGSGYDNAAATGGNAYYVRAVSGAGEGLYATITSVSGSVITLANAEVAAEFDSSTTLEIIEHHQIRDIFAPAVEGLSYEDGTQILVFDNTSGTAGQNPSADTVVTFDASTLPFPPFTETKEWVGGDKEYTILPPDSTYVVRNGGSNTLVVGVAGFTPENPVAYKVPAGASDDLVVSSGYPVDVILGPLGLGGVDGRQVLTFDNAAAGFNKTADKVTTFDISALPFPPFTVTEEWIGGDAEDTVIGFGDGYTVRVDGEAGSVVKVTKPY